MKLTMEPVPVRAEDNLIWPGLNLPIFDLPSGLGVPHADSASIITSSSRKAVTVRTEVRQRRSTTLQRQDIRPASSIPDRDGMIGVVGCSEHARAVWAELGSWQATGLLKNEKLRP